MKREYYSDSIANFLGAKPEVILGKLAMSSDFALEQSQRDAWIEEIKILKLVLSFMKEQSISNIPSHELDVELTLYCSLGL